MLTGTDVLIVDDDIRNVFALTHVLGRVGIPVKYAENGREGLEVLERTPDVSLVLMDIMMPEMDGYETIAAIRRTPRLAGPADHRAHRQGHAGDREKAIDSGADDYVPKPVDVDRLLTRDLRPPRPAGRTLPAAASRMPTVRARTIRATGRRRGDGDGDVRTRTPDDRAPDGPS